jgi:methylsterol monooxygenase
MPFRYTRAPLTQSISSIVIVGGTLAAMATPAAEAGWAAFVTGTPGWVQLLVGPMVLHLAVFWGMVAAFERVDRTDQPAWIARHRIQSGKARVPPRDRVLRNLALNQGILAPVMLLLLWGALELRGWEVSATLPGPLTVLGELFGMAVCSLLWFYASHRLLHRTWWMKRVHRVHHEFRTTRAIASEYAHWFEFVVANFGTLACGVVLLGPSLPSIYLYTVLSLHTILAHHSGYAVPWLSWSVPHDWHHYKYTEIYGSVGILDRLLGTDKVFRTLEDGEVRR